MAKEDELPTQPVPPPVAWAEGDAWPQKIRDYRVLRLVGEGGYGRVLEAYDEKLQRRVALKLLKGQAVVAETGTGVLKEAITGARMEHPSFARVYDAFVTDEGQTCIVSEFIDGETLADRLAKGRPFSAYEAAIAAAEVSEALHFAHERHRVVHRDVKPANLMLREVDGRPVLLDFGLARDLQEAGERGAVMGSVGYMSPEQARGEDPMVKERSDIYSLGVIFYEMLTGRAAFPVETREQQLELLLASGPLPPVEVNALLPAELSRICMKAMQPQMSQRYASAAEMAQDIREWLDHATVEEAAAAAGAEASTDESPTEQLRRRAMTGRSATAGTARASGSSRPQSSRQQVEAVLVPQGLRAFDEDDRDAYLALVPGPRDLHGLPESLRFWKQRIESFDSALAFPIGVLGGPSGCGKTSLLRAGLLPRCGDHVKICRIEARHAGNATRLAKALHQLLPGLKKDEWQPAKLLYAVRKGQVLLPTQKLLIVIDQLEQWLPAWEQCGNSDGQALIDALRHCDGVSVQALLVVRNDFWLGVQRLLDDANDGINSNNHSIVDLFEPRHAEEVLERFGRAYHRLPADAAVAKQFITKAVHLLGEPEKVSPVRLSLLAAMLSDKPWTPALLSDVGGAAGIAQRFLDETFLGRYAEGPWKAHLSAAYALLESLVPPEGNMRGPARTQSLLVAASGYAADAKEGHELLQWLSSELRLITMVDAKDIIVDEPVWQLTHDELVPALRQWLQQRKASSRRGRAQLALTERANEWHLRRTIQRLPRLGEWLWLRLFTSSKRWSEVEREWMHQGMLAALLLCGKSLLVLMLLLLPVFLNQRERDARAFTTRLLEAKPTAVASLLKTHADVFARALPLIESAAAQEPASQPHGLNARLALLPQRFDFAVSLSASLPTASAEAFAAIVDALHTTRQTPGLELYQRNLTNSEASPAQKLRSAAVLAAFAPEDSRLAAASQQLALWLVAEDLELRAWSLLLRPASAQLLPHLEALLSPSTAQPLPSSRAAEALAAMNEADEAALIRLVQQMPVASLPIAVTALRHHATAVKHLQAQLKPIPRPSSANKILTAEEEAFIQAQAQLVLTLFALGDAAPFWRRLVRDEDRSLRTSLMLQAFSAGLEPKLLITHLLAEKNAGIRHALVIALTQTSRAQIPESLFQSLLEWMRRAYRQDPDGGTHSAIATLLTHWGMSSELVAMQAALPRLPAPAPYFTWWVTPSGLDMRIISVAEGKRVAVSACEITVSSYQELLPQAQPITLLTDDLREPVRGLAWGDAARFCMALTQADGLPASEQNYLLSEAMPVRIESPQVRRGFRLPGAAEWMAAVASSKKYHWDFGGSAAMLRHFAWFAANSQGFPHPVAQLLPNESGLWDTIGNVSEFTNDTTTQFNLPMCYVLGQTYSSEPALVRVDHRVMISPLLVNYLAGLRVVREIP